MGSDQLYSLHLPLSLIPPPGWKAGRPLHASPAAMDHGSVSVVWLSSRGAGLIGSNVGGYLVSTQN